MNSSWYSCPRAKQRRKSELKIEFGYLRTIPKLLRYFCLFLWTIGVEFSCMSSLIYSFFAVSCLDFVPLLFLASRPSFLFLDFPFLRSSSLRLYGAGVIVFCRLELKSPFIPMKAPPWVFWLRASENFDSSSAVCSFFLAFPLFNFCLKLGLGVWNDLVSYLSLPRSWKLLSRLLPC